MSTNIYQYLSIDYFRKIRIIAYLATSSINGCSHVTIPTGNDTMAVSICIRRVICRVVRVMDLIIVSANQILIKISTHIRLRNEVKWHMGSSVSWPAVY